MSSLQSWVFKSYRGTVKFLSFLLTIISVDKTGKEEIKREAVQPRQKIYKNELNLMGTYDSVCYVWQTNKYGDLVIIWDCWDFKIWHPLCDNLFEIPEED